MEKKRIVDHQFMEIMIRRLSQELVENHQDFKNSVILGLQPRGIYLAERIHTQLQEMGYSNIPIGYLDVTFYRDDFRRRDTPLHPNTTKVSFYIEDKNVILIDDVLYTGRTVRAALDGMIAFGRPRKVELMVLINRLYTRDLPIEPDYTGREVNTTSTQRVIVQWQNKEFEQNEVWLSEAS